MISIMHYIFMTINCSLFAVIIKSLINLSCNLWINLQSEWLVADQSVGLNYTIAIKHCEGLCF